MQTAMVRFALCGLLMALAHSANSPPMASAATAPPDRFCYSYLFRNDTAADANDLHIGFSDPSGSGVVSDVYLGPDNPFISVTLASSVNVSGPVNTSIDYTNGTVSPGESAHIGFCNRASKMRSTPYWTLNGAAVKPNPLMLGIEWQWSDLKTLKVALFNDQAVTMTVTSFWLYDASIALSSEVLVPAAEAGMQPVVNLSEDALVLAPNSTQTLQVKFGTSANAANSAEALITDYAISPNHPFVLGIASAPVDDLNDETQLILQAYSPQAAYLPMVVR